MARAGGAWVPDGRAKTIRADCEASLVALDGVPIDIYLIHAPDPRTPWRTSVRALALWSKRAWSGASVCRTSIAGAGRGARARSRRGGRGRARPAGSPRAPGRARRALHRAGIAVIAHSPLGGPRRAGRLARLRPLAVWRAAHGVTAAEVALAWLLGAVWICGRDPGRAAPGDRAQRRQRGQAESGPPRPVAVLSGALGAPVRRGPKARSRGDAEVGRDHGHPRGGQDTAAPRSTSTAGYLRLNRDERGGTLRQIAGALDEQLSAGVVRVVLDNTFLSRAARSYVIEATTRHAVPVRCIWLSTPLAQAQVNLVGRLLDVAGTLPGPDELRALARVAEGVMAPTSQMRALRELEPPSADEGFAGVEVVPFSRAEPSEPGGIGVLRRGRRPATAGLDAGDRAGRARSATSRVRLEPGRTAGRARPLRGEAHVGRSPARSMAPSVHMAAGPPRCWCRPALPGLPLAFAREHGLALVTLGPRRRRGGASHAGARRSSGGRRAGTDPGLGVELQGMAATEATIVDAGGREVRVSNPDRVIFPPTERSGEVTKLDIVEYYLAVGDGIMRALRPTTRRPSSAGPRACTRESCSRPVTGAAAMRSFRSAFRAGRPDYVQTARIQFPSGRSADEVCPTEVAVVGWAAQMGTITFHPWPVRSDDVDHPDELRLDLDPQPGHRLR